MTEERKRELARLLEEAKKEENLEIRSHLEDVALLCCSMRSEGTSPLRNRGFTVTEG